MALWCRLVQHSRTMPTLKIVLTLCFVLPLLTSKKIEDSSSEADLPPAYNYPPKNQTSLIKILRDLNKINSSYTAVVMANVDRACYANVTDPKDNPYTFEAVILDYRTTMSPPTMHALALDTLHDYLKEGNKVLDVGSGCGYFTSCIGLMLLTHGLVVGIEHIPELTEFARRNIKEDQPMLLKSGRIKLVTGDGRLGFPEEAPYDAIHVGASGTDVPEPLLQQLKVGGRLMMPLVFDDLNENMTMLVVDRKADGYHRTYLNLTVYFEPLCNKTFQLD